MWLLSLGRALEHRGIRNVRLLCPMADGPELLLKGMGLASVESVIAAECRKARRIIGDPIYARLIPEEPERFLRFPHEAYSGRHYRSEIPLFVGPAFDAWLDGKL